MPSSTTKPPSPPSHSSPQEKKQYYTLSYTDADLKSSAMSSSWQEPFIIEDEDLMFDGKPLNLLYEENQNRYFAEGRGDSERTQRGRSRCKK